MIEDAKNITALGLDPAIFQYLPQMTHHFHDQSIS